MERASLLKKSRGVDIVSFGGEAAAYAFVTDPPSVFVLDSFIAEIVSKCADLTVRDAIELISDATVALDGGGSAEAERILEELVRRNIFYAQSCAQ